MSIVIFPSPVYGYLTKWPQNLWGVNWGNHCCVSTCCSTLRQGVLQSLAGLGVGGLPGRVLLLAEDRSLEKRAVWDFISNTDSSLRMGAWANYKDTGGLSRRLAQHLLRLRGRWWGQRTQENKGCVKNSLWCLRCWQHGPHLHVTPCISGGGRWACWPQTVQKEGRV